MPQDTNKVHLQQYSSTVEMLTISTPPRLRPGFTLCLVVFGCFYVFLAVFGCFYVFLDLVGGGFSE